MVYKGLSPPPAYLEYMWYASLTYAMLGKVWGIVIPTAGGVLLVIIAVACVLSVGVQAIQVYRPVVWALTTGFLLISIQLLFHEGNPQALSEGISLVGWLALLLIVPALSLRPGFLKRFALAALAVGIATLPYIKMSGGSMERAIASGTGISNPNSLGMWFGFCTVFFLFWGFQLQKPILKVVSWTTALGCLYIVMLTVSRAPLLAIILACVVGFRSEMKRGFVPLFLLALLFCLVYVSGMFDEKINDYMARGAEETGRGRLFPIALQRVLDSPFIGVGLGDIMIRRSSGRGFMNPHNGLLHIALGGGIVPAICFLGYLARAVIGAFRIMQRRYVGESSLLPPLVVFALVEIMVLDYTFVCAWAVVVLSLAAGARQTDGYRRSVTALCNVDRARLPA